MILVIAEQRDGALNRATWETIGDELGIARQTAEKRFKTPRRRRPGRQ